MTAQLIGTRRQDFRGPVPTTKVHLTTIMIENCISTVDRTQPLVSGRLRRGLQDITKNVKNYNCNEADFRYQYSCLLRNKQTLCRNIQIFLLKKLRLNAYACIQ